MKKQFAQLHHIDHNGQITAQNHHEFLHHLQSALLLALREQGRLSAISYRHASQALRNQEIARARALLHRESDA